MSGCKGVLARSVLFFLIFQSPARADIGFLRLDSESYYLNSNSRPDSTNAMVFGPNFQATGHTFTTQIEAEGYLFVNDPQSFTVESQNAYIATSPELSPHHQVTLGRRMYDWSVADDVWKIGTWTPRFNWDPLNPEQVGNTGAFYTYESKSWRLLAFASGVAVPERGVPLNSNLTSPSGDWISPFSQINLAALNNTQININYNLTEPSINNLIFFPSAAMQVKYGEKYGTWTSAEYGYMPIHQADLLVQGAIPAQGQQLNVTVQPLILMQHLFTAEGGYRQKDWSVWASASREIPISQYVDPSWIQQPMGPANLLSAGASWDATRRFTVSTSVLSINEDLPAQPAANNLSLNLPSRFPYTGALQIAMDYRASERWDYRMLWINDIANVSELFSVDVGYKPSFRGDWFLGVGTDLITSASGQGLIGQFEGNDRVRARVAYAF